MPATPFKSKQHYGLRIADCGVEAGYVVSPPFTVARCRYDLCASTRNPQSAIRNPQSARPRSALRNALLFIFVLFVMPSVAQAVHLRLADGTIIEVEEAWEDAQGVWYRRDGVTHLVDRKRVKAIVRPAAGGEEARAASEVTPVVGPGDPVQEQAAEEVETVWVYLVGGARVEVDEASETAEGVWYKRGNLSIFLERSRVERVERERLTPAEVAGTGEKGGGRRERRWTTGSQRLDALIRQNGARHGVDPYLIFLVMEQESHFNSRAVSPAGARGLMQLMPGTAARFGVRNSFDPAQNVSAGTRYLRELLRRFNNRVDLVLAGYNAGEGNVIRFGHRVPPFRETRNYVRRITAKYKQ